MRATILTLLAILTMPLFGIEAKAQEDRPRLVVNIIVGSMRASDLERYGDNFGEYGFKRLMGSGAYFTDAEYDYSLTSTAAGLATLSTGAQPSIHGVVGDSWWDHVNNAYVELVADAKSQPVPFSTGSISCSPHRLQAPTLGDMIVEANPQSKQITIAINPQSAIVLNGKQGVAYWAERNKTYWTTSSAYLDKIPKWVADYNSSNGNNDYTIRRWEPYGAIAYYHNSEVAVVEDIKGKRTNLISGIDLHLDRSLYGQMCYTPAGNTMLLEFATQAVTHEALGRDSATDILNIYLDTSRYITEVYGPESIEYEDMLYRLDADIARFLTYLYVFVGSEEDVVVVLTSDHGTAPSYNPHGSQERERFNHRQMEVIVNAFLGARYGSGNYVIGFANNALYLNHELLNSKKLSIATIQEEVATFLLQMRGVSTALSATALRNTSFCEGRQRLMQQSFHATRSGDVVIDFMPGWMVESLDYRSTSHAGYLYDRSVPLIICGGGVATQRVVRTVSIAEVAPTIAHLVGVDAPWASSARPMTELDY